MQPPPKKGPTLHRTWNEEPCLIKIGSDSYALNYIRHSKPSGTNYYSLLRNQKLRGFYTFTHPFTKEKFNYTVCPDPKLVLTGPYTWATFSTHPGKSNLDLLLIRSDLENTKPPLLLKAPRTE